MVGDDVVSRKRQWGAQAASGRLRAVALCEPHYFDISCKINDWHREHEGKRIVDRSKAQRQFEDLASLYEALGTEIYLIEPNDACPYQVFTRDTAVVLNAGAILTEPSTDVRRAEVHATRQLVEQIGIPVIDEVQGEGGDVVFTRHDMVAVARSNRTQTTALADAIARTAPSIQVHQVTHKSSTHLDTIFAVVDPETCVITRCGVSDSLQELIESTFTVVITLDDSSLGAVANNFIVVSPRTIIASAGAHEQNEVLMSHDIVVHEVDLSEFNLSGAGPRCMTLEILREV